MITASAGVPWDNGHTAGRGQGCGLAQHKILTKVPSHEIVNSDLVVEVRADDERLGELLVSRGTIDWRPARSQFVYKLAWHRFDELMQQHGRKQRKP